MGFKMTRNNGALHGPLKFKLHCAKLGADDMLMYSPQFLESLPNTFRRTIPSKKSQLQHKPSKRRQKKMGFKMTRNNGALHGPLKFKLHCAKLGFVYSKIAFLEVQRPMGRDTTKNKWAASSVSTTSGNDETLARLMVIEYANLNDSYNVKKTQNWEALEIRKNVPKLKEQELRMREYEQ
ncbi:hypothetical protein Tco_1498267, partial [Tanacetum coccineum]